ncbi:MAG: flagellar hook-associated protein FlgL [Candidatus Cloacimonetes bacterium]|nr:flagellar hook-associated protein FlgL [Candidatus Cloacimonadota bacterium]
MRVTTNTMMQGLVNQVGRNMAEYHKYNEMIANERRINKPQDDPLGLATAIRHYGNATAYEQYEKNIRDASEYLRQADSTLNNINDLLSRAREIAEGVATETASVIEKEIAAAQIQELINEAIGYANTKVRDRYLFAGTLGENQAYSLGGKILTPLASTNNLYDNIVEAGGSYEGTAEFIVRFTREGFAADPSHLDPPAMYQISSDGGLTWSDPQEMTNLTINIVDSDGNDTSLTMRFQPEKLGEGDEFRLQIVSGKYMGNSDPIEFNNNMYSRVLTNVTGQSLFEDTLFFDKLYQLKNACEHGNGLEIQEALGHFNKLQTDMQTMVTSMGLELNRLEITKSNLTSLKENVLDSIQGIEKVDVVDVLTMFGMAENALNSSISALGKVFPVSLMNYL